eukprot:scaffold42784_cov214-Amphora_coffeaeformis.AAC.11
MIRLVPYNCNRLVPPLGALLILWTCSTFCGKLPGTERLGRDCKSVSDRDNHIAPWFPAHPKSNRECPLPIVQDWYCNFVGKSHTTEVALVYPCVRRDFDFGPTIPPILVEFSQDTPVTHCHRHR